MFLNLHRIFPIGDVPLETEDLTSWLYQRFIEKEDLLSHFYKTGTQPFPCTLSSYQRF